MGKWLKTWNFGFIRDDLLGMICWFFSLNNSWSKLPLNYMDEGLYGWVTVYKPPLNCIDEVSYPRSCRPQMGPMLVPWTLLSGMPQKTVLCNCLSILISDKWYLLDSPQQTDNVLSAFLIDTVSGNGLSLDGIKPLPELMLSYHYWDPHLNFKTSTQENLLNMWSV